MCFSAVQIDDLSYIHVAYMKVYLAATKAQQPPTTTPAAAATTKTASRWSHDWSTTNHNYKSLLEYSFFSFICSVFPNYTWERLTWFHDSYLWMRCMKHFCERRNVHSVSRSWDKSKKNPSPDIIRTDNVQLPLECSNHWKTCGVRSSTKFKFSCC